MSLRVDQLFSRIAEYLKGRDAYDRNDILAAIKHGFQGTRDDRFPPVTANLDRAANISTWVEPYLAPTPHVTEFRQFKLEMHEGQVCVSARYRCSETATGNEWLNLNLKPADVSPVHIYLHSFIFFIRATNLH